jgi:hypothetical protein
MYRENLFSVLKPYAWCVYLPNRYSVADMSLCHLWRASSEVPGLIVQLFTYMSRPVGFSLWRLAEAARVPFFPYATQTHVTVPEPHQAITAHNELSEAATLAGLRNLLVSYLTVGIATCCNSKNCYNYCCFPTLHHSGRSHDTL